MKTNIYIIICHSILRRLKNVSEKSCRENQNTHFVLNNLFFFNRAFYEQMWKNIVEPGRPQMTNWHMLIACWIPKATNTHSNYVTHIAVPVQQLLHERASLLRHTYIACLVNFTSVTDIPRTSGQSPKRSRPLR